MPSELFTRGSLPLDRPPCVAIVGSRRPSPYGEEVTHRFATALAKRGVIIISGLAFGVDAIAHQACIDAGGTTIAVLPGGLHDTYPRTHAALARRIIESGGALLSEHSPGVEPHKYHFLARNRLVSGLADAVLVTEATDRSGTFSTVAHALTQNKEVFAVPGPITSLLSAGTNRILQEGAHVALTPDDILEVIAPTLKRQQVPLALGSNDLETAIIRLIREGVRDSEGLIAALHTPAHEVLQSLGMLELNGIVRKAGSGWSVIE